MFTGIIEGLGTIKGIQPRGQGKRMTIQAEFLLEGTKTGDSISVSGACLTAVTIQGNTFSVDVSPETLHRSILGNARVGERINLERALRFSDRLDGHLVSGHIDGTGTIAEKSTLANAILVTVKVPESMTRYMIEKGSVAVDGISLTINIVSRDRFQVSIIPYTANLTTVGFKPVGSDVNIETDMIGKWVERFLKSDAQDKKTSGIDMAFLAESGFL